MAFSFNNVSVGGNITRDIEFKTTPNGTSVANVGLAVNDRIKKGEEWVEDTCFVDITVFGKLAERVSNQLKKGDSVIFTGRLKQDKWVDKATGQNRYKLYVIANEASFVKWGKDRQGNGGTEEAPPF